MSMLPYQAMRHYLCNVVEHIAVPKTPLSSRRDISPSLQHFTSDF